MRERERGIRRRKGREKRREKKKREEGKKKRKRREKGEKEKGAHTTTRWVGRDACVRSHGVPYGYPIRPSFP